MFAGASSRAAPDIRSGAVVSAAFTTKSASVVLIRRCPRRCGRPLQRDVHGLKVLSCYAHIMTFENRAAVVAARDLTECNIVRQALDQLLEQGDAAKRDPNSPWRTTYGGRTEDNNSAIDRKDLHFSDKPSGAKKLQAFLRERERLAAFMTVHSRLLANGEDNFETEQLEALLGQFAGVGGVVGLNVAHMGPWRYGKKGDLTALRFCMRASRNGHGGATIREATRPCRRTLRRSVPRRTHPNNRYAPQVLDDDNLYQWWPDGHTALRDLAESSWAPANFVSTDKLLTVTVTQVLQNFSENGAKARAAKRLAVDEGLKKLGLDKAHFSYAVKDVSPYEAAAAAAILESVASCDTYELKVAAVVAVEQVFQAVDEPLDRILLGLRIDGSYERHELAEVLEECRDVMRHSGGEAHVAALIEYARADVEALANLSSDDVLESLVKKSEELRPGAGPSWTPIADALNELGVPRTGGKEWERRYVHSHYLSLHSNKTPLTEDERRMVHALEWELGHDWAEIARRLGNGRDSNKIKCYWHDRSWTAPTRGRVWLV